MAGFMKGETNMVNTTDNYYGISTDDKNPLGNIINRFESNSYPNDDGPEESESVFVKAFRQYSRMDYYDVLTENKAISGDSNLIDDVLLGNFDSNDEGVEYEFAMRWETLGNETVARLSIYDESFKCFDDHRELFAELAKLNGKTISPYGFCKLLLGLGYADFSDKEMESENG